MSNVATVYGQALYGLAKDEGLAEAVLQQMSALDESFRAEPEFVRLLCAANLTKDQRCAIVDESFRGKVEQCLLNFMKLLTEKGYMRQFSGCCKVFREQYNADHGILEVRAVTAAPLTEQQHDRLRSKLVAITGKTISLICSVDPKCLGGVRLDYDGKRLDDTLQHRLDSIRTLLADTVL